MKRLLILFILIGAAIANENLEKASPQLKLSGHGDGLIYTPNSPKTVFTEEEKAYLQNKKSLRVHVEKDWAPFNYMENGEVKGFANDYMKLLGDKIGVEVEFVQGYTWAEYMAMLKRSEIDIISTITITPKREESYLFSNSSILDILISLVIKKGTKNLTLEQLGGKKIATVNGYVSNETLTKYYPKIKLVKVDSNLEILQAVINGKADVGLGNYAVLDYLMNKNFISGLVNAPIVGNRYLKSMPQHVAINKNERLLKQIVDKGILNISDKEVTVLRDKCIRDRERKGSIFTKEELAYLKNKKEIKMCVDPNWMPFEKIDKNGNYIGILSEYIKLFSNKLQIKFSLQKTTSYKQSRKYLTQLRHQHLKPN